MLINLKNEIYIKKTNTLTRVRISKAIKYLQAHSFYEAIDFFYEQYCIDRDRKHYNDVGIYKLLNNYQLREYSELLQQFYIKCAVDNININPPRDHVGDYDLPEKLEYDLFARDWLCMNCGNKVNNCALYHDAYICNTCAKQIFISDRYNPVFAFGWKDLMKKNGVYMFYDNSYKNFSVFNNGYFCYGIQLKDN